MTGQDAIKSAGEFNRRIGVTGVVLTKMDGDARGGAALSVVSVVGVPIAFVGSGERLEDLEPFHADRVVSRMLGMGDVLSLIEKAEEASTRRTPSGSNRRSGRTSSRSRTSAISSDHPEDGAAREHPRDAAGHGQDEAAGASASRDEKQMGRVEAIIGSMTPRGARNHAVINGSRRKRIARGSGTSVEDVNRLFKQFIEMKRMLKMVGGRPAASGGGRR